MDAPVVVHMSPSEFVTFDGDPRPVAVKAGEKAGVSADVVDTITIVRSPQGGHDMTVVLREPRSQQEAQARGELADGKPSTPPPAAAAPFTVPTTQSVPDAVHQYPDAPKPEEEMKAEQEKKAEEAKAAQDAQKAAEAEEDKDEPHARRQSRGRDKE